MKIRPVILCGGAGTRLWSDSKNHQAKQFIDFGGWTLFGKTLDRIKSPFFDYPIISTNKKYLKEIKRYLKKYKISKYKIILEPLKRNTGPAILSTSLISDIPQHQPILFLSSDHLIEKSKTFNRVIKKTAKFLSDKNIFIFGIKPTNPSDQYGYFFTNNISNRLKKVKKFTEKPNIQKAKKIIHKGGYWNSGIFLIRKDSIIFNYKKYQPTMYKRCKDAISKSKFKNKIYHLNKRCFSSISTKSFDRAILEKTKNIYAVKLDISWSDLGSWKEICLMYNRNKLKYFNKKNIFYRPWGKYTNLFNGKNFLIKEIHVNPKGILSLQKHFYRSEHWVIIKGKPLINLNKKIIFKKENETIFIPKGSVHRISNPNNKPVKIIEAQLGSILKETDIVRFEDVYGRVS